MKRAPRFLFILQTILESVARNSFDYEKVFFSNFVTLKEINLYYKFIIGVIFLVLKESCEMKKIFICLITLALSIF